MKKQILNLGKALNTLEQKQVNGGDSRKPFLCDVINGQIYACYLPTRCSLNSDGTYSCV